MNNNTIPNWFDFNFIAWNIAKRVFDKFATNNIGITKKIAFLVNKYNIINIPVYIITDISRFDNTELNIAIDNLLINDIFLFISCSAIFGMGCWIFQQN